MPLAMACARWMVCQASTCCSAVLRFFGRVPADGGGVEEDVGALEGGEARAFGIPLIPAHEDADAAEGGIEIAEAEVAGREIELLEVERVVGDVHFAVQPGDFAIGLRTAAVL
jgi:hypothetical protein